MNLVQSRLETHIGEYTARIAMEKIESKAPQTHTHRYINVSGYININIYIEKERERERDASLEHLKYDRSLESVCIKYTYKFN